MTSYRCPQHDKSDPKCQGCQLEVAQKRLALQQEKLDVDRQLLRAEKKSLRQRTSSQDQQQKNYKQAFQKQERELEVCRARIEESEAQLEAHDADEIQELQLKLREAEERASQVDDLQAQLQNQHDDYEGTIGELHAKIAQQENDLQRLQRGSPDSLAGSTSSHASSYQIQQYKNKLQSLRLAMEVAVRHTETEWKEKFDELEVHCATQEGEFEERLEKTTEELKSQISELQAQLARKEQVHAEEQRELQAIIENLQGGGEMAAAAAKPVVALSVASNETEHEEFLKTVEELKLMKQIQKECLESQEQVLVGLRSLLTEVSTKSDSDLVQHVPAIREKTMALERQVNELQKLQGGNGIVSLKRASSKRVPLLTISKNHHVSDYDWKGANQKGKYTGYVNNNGEPHGRGMLLVDNGDVYEGEWKNGKRHGQGVYTWKEGDLYTGPWCKNKRHGHGVFVWSDGRLYDGGYNMGKREGKGIFTWPYGAKYEGEYKGNRRNGYGVYVKSTGETHSGQYQDDRPHGPGVETDPSGKVLNEGTWLAGLFVGNPPE